MSFAYQRVGILGNSFMKCCARSTALNTYAETQQYRFGVLSRKNISARPLLCLNTNNRQRKALSCRRKHFWRVMDLFTPLWGDYGPYALDRDYVLREDARRELQSLNKKANALLCSLYKIPQHTFGPRVDLLRNNEVVLNDKHKYQIFLHAEGFQPHEITVEEVDGKLIVKGDHQERADEHGFVERSFLRTYLLPKEVIANELVSRLTPEGILVIEAAKHEALPERSTSRSIPIQHDSGAATNAKSSKYNAIASR